MIKNRSHSCKLLGITEDQHRERTCVIPWGQRQVSVSFVCNTYPREVLLVWLRHASHPPSYGLIQLGLSNLGWKRNDPRVQFHCQWQTMSLYNELRVNKWKHTSNSMVLGPVTGPLDFLQGIIIWRPIIKSYTKRRKASFLFKIILLETQSTGTLYLVENRIKWFLTVTLYLEF